MIQKFIHDDSRNWDKWLVPLLFAAWKEVVSVSLISVDQEKDELGPEVPTLTNLISPVSDSHLFPEPENRPSIFAKALCGCVLPLTRPHASHKPPN